jgi:hypothetical protein
LVRASSKGGASELTHSSYSMLTENDFKETTKTLNILSKVIDEDSPRRFSFLDLLKLIEFATTTIAVIMFTKDGKPKSKLQLILSIPAIIRFAKDFLSRLNHQSDGKTKGDKKVAEQIEKSVKKSQKDGK